MMRSHIWILPSLLFVAFFVWKLGLVSFSVTKDPGAFVTLDTHGSETHSRVYGMVKLPDDFARLSSLDTSDEPKKDSGVAEKNHGLHDVTDHAVVVKKPAPNWEQNRRCNFYSWDPPTLCPTGNNHWSDKDLKDAIPEFAKMYRLRPVDKNPGGMGINHAYALWFTVRALKPKHIVESGAKKGFTTWLLRDAAGPDAWIYSIDPATKKQRKFARDGLDTLAFRDKNPKTKYFRNFNFVDVAAMKWNSLIPTNERNQTFVLLDDHMAVTRRVQELLAFGFMHLFYDDNAKLNNDCYSFNWICSPLPEGMSQVPFIDYFGTSRKTISVDEHRKNVDYLLKHVDIYFEFPPIFDGCRGARSGCRDDTCSLLEEEQLKQLQLPSISEETANYVTNHPPYVASTLPVGTIALLSLAFIQPSRSFVVWLTVCSVGAVGFVVWAGIGEADVNVSVIVTMIMISKALVAYCKGASMYQLKIGASHHQEAQRHLEAAGGIMQVCSFSGAVLMFWLSHYTTFFPKQG